MAAHSNPPSSSRRARVAARVVAGDRLVADLAIERANTIWRRTAGLMGRRGLPEATGLLIEPCGSVHTSFMRFPIDVVYLDRDGRVVKVVAALKPWRMSFGGRRAKSTLELAAGEADRLGVVAGMQLRLEA